MPYVLQAAGNCYAYWVRHSAESVLGHDHISVMSSGTKHDFLQTFFCSCLVSALAKTAVLPSGQCQQACRRVQSPCCAPVWSFVEAFRVRRFLTVGGSMDSTCESARTLACCKRLHSFVISPGQTMRSKSRGDCGTCWQAARDQRM